MDEKKVLEGLVQSEIKKLAESADGDNLPDSMSFTFTMPDGIEISFQVLLQQVVEKKRQYHHWYGGNVATVTISIGEDSASCDVDANGDIRIWLNGEDDEEICRVKDNGNNGGFYELSNYIPDDEFLAALLAQQENEQGFTLHVHDSNWWELFPSDKDVFSTVLDGYSLTDVLVEAAAYLYQELTNNALKGAN